MNIQPKQQYKCNKCEKPNFEKGALTTHIKKAHNMFNTLPRRSSWQVPQIINQTTITKTLKQTNLRWNMGDSL